MKKLISLLLTSAMLIGTIPALAETDDTLLIAPAPSETATELPAENATEAPTELPEQIHYPASDGFLADRKITVTATIEEVPYPIDSDVTLAVYTKDGKFISDCTRTITGDTKSVTFEFGVPSAAAGDEYIVRGIKGFDSILYYSDRYFPNKDLTFPIYNYADSNGNMILSTDIAISIRPLFSKSVNLYYNGNALNFTGVVLDENTMVPAIKLGSKIGFNAYYDAAYNSVAMGLGSEYIFFNVGTAYTTVFGQDIAAQAPTMMIGDEAYISLRTFADSIGSELLVEDKYTHLDIYMGESSKATEYFATLPVNQWGITSRTNYLVWVSLGEYKVRVYQGSQGKWQPIHEATCAIGAPWTPSIVGSYEYQYRVPAWHYGSYYVGPCLVFHGGYALHSVKLRYDGTEYDGRVGVGISLGCIRLKKADIDFIDRTIPVGTRIYSTY